MPLRKCRIFLTEMKICLHICQRTSRLLRSRVFFPLFSFTYFAQLHTKKPKMFSHWLNNIFSKEACDRFCWMKDRFISSNHPILLRIHFCYNTLSFKQKPNYLRAPGLIHSLSFSQSKLFLDFLEPASTLGMLRLTLCNLSNNLVEC